MSTNKNLPERAAADIRRLAKKHGVEKVVLFGSRARGTHGPKSDIDLAVYGGRDNIAAFAGAVEDEAWTLLPFDLIDMNAPLSGEFAAGIEREGVVLYEKV